MNIGSKCSDCLVCECSGHCLAGHGDDHFIKMSKKKLNGMLKSKAGDLNKNEIKYIKEKLKEWYS